MTYMLYAEVTFGGPDTPGWFNSSILLTRSIRVSIEKKSKWAMKQLSLYLLPSCLANRLSHFPSVGI